MATVKELPDCGIMSEAAVLQFAENGLLYDISDMYGAGIQSLWTVLYSGMEECRWPIQRLMKSC